MTMNLNTNMDRIEMGMNNLAIQQLEENRNNPEFIRALQDALIIDIMSDISDDAIAYRVATYDHEKYVKVKQIFEAFGVDIRLAELAKIISFKKEDDVDDSFEKLSIIKHENEYIFDTMINSINNHCDEMINEVKNNEDTEVDFSNIMKSMVEEIVRSLDPEFLINEMVQNLQ